MINEDLRKWFKEKWVRLDTKGNIKGECARGEGEGKPKCLPVARARAMSKEDRAKAARRKRRKDPVADRKGKGEKPVFVQTEELILEKNVPTNSELWSRAKALAKKKFDVYPSAYANGWAAKWYKARGGKWKSMNEETNPSKTKNNKIKGTPITDTKMPTADRSVSGGGRGILENDESGNVVNFRRKKDDLHPKSNDWKKLHDAVQQKLDPKESGSTKVGTKGLTITGYAPKNNPPNRKRIEGAMRAAANTNEETILKEARKALGKMATKPKSAKIKYISKLTKPPAEKKPKQTRKRSKKWDYNKEVKALKDKFENDMKTYRDPVMRAVIKKQHRTELKALKSIHRVHKGKHPDPIYKRLLSSFGIHLEEYGAGEQGTDALVQKYINDTPGQQCSKTVKTIKKVVSEAARRYDPVAGYRRGRPFRGGRRMKARKSGKSRQIDASRPRFVAGKVKRKMNRQAQKAMRRTMTVTARGT